MSQSDQLLTLVLKEKEIVSKEGALIRLDQRTIWYDGWQNFLRDALHFCAKTSIKGFVIHPDDTAYTESSAYVDAHNASGELPLSSLVPFEGACLRMQAHTAAA